MKHLPNLRQVEAFRAVMLTGKITAAAELMGVTQPAVSRLIADFEHATRLRLLERRGNRITPTREAVALMREVDRAFVGLGRIADAAEEIGRSSRGTLRIAGMAALAYGLLPRAMARFLRERPDVGLTLTGLSSATVIETVASGQTDIGYVDEPFDRRGFTVRDVPGAALVAIPENHALAAKEVIEPRDLTDQHLIRVDIATAFATRTEVALSGIPHRGSVRTNWWQSALNLVAEGVGLALVDPVSALEFVGRPIAFRPFSVFIDAGFQEVRPASGEAALSEAFSAVFSAQHARDLENFANGPSRATTGFAPPGPGR